MGDNHTVKVDLGERSYDIIVQQGILSQSADILSPFTTGKKCHIISDSNVAPLYADRVKNTLTEAGAKVSLSIIPAGEQNKHLTTVAGLFTDAVNAGLDRGSLIIALGGGVPGDIAGFTAATYMRGIKFIQIPSSLLAMVDSSVGGKTGVDLPEGKNLVGAFWQPELVLIDSAMLNTLPEREVRCGLAEIVKYGVIIDEEFFARLEQNIDKLNALDLDFYSEVIARCCELKAHVVSQDEKEAGLRAILNYGHTFGHALEAMSNFTIGHGEGVSIGMCMAADLAVKLDMLTPEAAQRQERLLKALKLPVRTSGYNVESIVNAMSKDKKTLDGKLVFILPQAIGKVSIEKGIDRQLVTEAVRGRCD